MAAPHTSFGLRERVEDLLAEQMERARGIVKQRRHEIAALAEALLKNQKLSAEDINTLLKCPSGHEVRKDNLEQLVLSQARSPAP